MEAATTTTSNGAISGGTENIHSAIHSVESNSNGEAVISIDASNWNAETAQRQINLKTEKHYFKLMDSLYHAAANGETKSFKKDADFLSKLLTPNGNTILHIHITARPPPAQPSKANSFMEKLCLKKRSGDGISPNNNFLKDILHICPHLLWQANKKGETLLHMAARHGHADVTEMLITECKKPYQNDSKRGIEAIQLMLGSINEAKDTALHEAVRYNHVNVVKILTSNARDLSYKPNNAGETPLYLAAERGYKDILKDILDTCHSPAHEGPGNRTALHAAVITGDLDMTKMLLDKKGSLTHEADERRSVPLHKAVSKGYAAIAKELLMKDESAAYERNEKGLAPIHIAAGTGRINIMEQLMLKCPGCFELVDFAGMNILHYALKFNRSKAVNFVLQNPLLGNLINERDNKGNTPLLQHAASGSHMPSFIRHSKVDKLAFDSQGYNAADLVSTGYLDFDPEFNGAKWRRDLKISCCKRIKKPRDKSSESKEEGGNCNKNNNVSKEDKSNKVSEIKGAREAHLIVATLIATVTFTAGFVVPGGFINDKGPDQGAAVLIGSAAFKAFVIFNTIAMILSSSVVFLHLLLALTKNESRFLNLLIRSLNLTAYAMLAMVLAYITGTYSILNHSPGLAISACVIGCIYFFVYTALPLDINFRFFVRNMRHRTRNICTLFVDYLPKCGR